ncbi:nitrite reductase small subunit NirD [Phytoactinopolyspora mesophila]|uniref:Nitrite reductase small subunit NirD n=1 Tax=Phytoactinopolyspora mesophila TaxID=2650750 RepID=A0A7K3MED2_9ACTN|nr:nitrite reductase small subunit NirD [Phytoactinopolyspora mesophila]NDL60768.1 nitrite reductase small subunit NirD [Phytoactinopolyspora mesophila]
MTTDLEALHSVLHNVAPNAPSAGHNQWHAVCEDERLAPERGVAALVDGQQIAVFRTYGGDVYALSNRDPFSGAYVLSRGIIGTRGDIPTVASPMHKEVFDLRTGECLDNPVIGVQAFGARVREGRIEVLVPGTTPPRQVDATGRGSDVAVS